MTIEVLTPDKMREILTSEHGVIFFPKRKLTIPTIEDEHIRRLFGSKDFEYIRDNIVEINDFLKGHAVGDKFGSDHNSRRLWRTKMFKEFGNVFLEVYYNHNQFRVNNLGIVRLNIFDFANYAHDSDLSKQFSSIGMYLTQAVQGSLTQGKMYKQVENIQEKLKVVHTFEDKSLEALSLIARQK